MTILHSKIWLIGLGTLLVPGLSLAQESLRLGRFQARAILRPARAACPAPLVILIPGSGANGPEEMMPGTLTADGQEHSIFGEFAEGLERGRAGSLALGKPGIELFSGWDKEKFFYDRSLYQNLEWHNLLENVDDAVEYARNLPCVDPNRIYLLGHSEGTVVAIDYAAAHPRKVRGLMLVGLAGQNLKKIVEWQLFRRPLDAWIAPDVDADHDGFVTKEEAAAWPEVQWDWSKNGRASFAEIEADLRKNAEAQAAYAKTIGARIWQEVIDRGPIFERAAALPEDIVVMTGTADVQTVPEDAVALKAACDAAGKTNCELHLVPGLGHAMSEPKAPRRQKYLDSTLGPVAESFKLLLATISARL